MLSKRKNVSVIGAGVSPSANITLQSIEIIKKSECIVYFSDPQLVKMFDDMKVKQYISLDDLYFHGAVDDDAYQAILSRILSLLSTYNNVVFIQQGNPRFGVSLIDMLEEASISHGFNLDVFPAVSSFDSMIIDVKRDPLEHGTVIVDANRLLLFSYKMEPSHDYYIYHICSVGTKKTNIDNASEDNKLELLQQKLTEIYPKNHQCSIIQTSGVGRNNAIIRNIEVSSLVNNIIDISFGTSLFIPCIGRPEVHEDILSMFDL